MGVKMQVPETAKEFYDSLVMINEKIEQKEKSLKGLCAPFKLKMDDDFYLEWSPEDERIMVQSWQDYCPLRYSSIQTRVNSLNFLDKF